ncbi:hypothetical protein CB0940_07033 [Cercospora beticola]|uniref:Uncharacterized protein n=1 Tax=Cercospora beticola TaxID=122368 RepID=A0A2G5H7P0_CERBT|nr:hypothetical protein CB0940_07033 [Cercospora beticola]PIA88538.1 hypothetical protein CB0940_07033 [Cercospora beticola]WPB02956.1 hypothetical protein RHO25_007592 [Cercospora beticola]
MSQTTYTSQTQRNGTYAAAIDNGKFEWCPRQTTQASSAATEGSNGRREQYRSATSSAEYDAPTSLAGIGAQFEQNQGRKS